MCFYKVCLISIVFYFNVIFCSQSPTHVLLTRVGPCYDPQDTIIKVSELNVIVQTYNSKLSGVIHISKNVSNGWKIKATMQKCVDIRNIDSCDFFKTFYVINNGCSADKEEHYLYDTVFNYTSPKMTCPLQAGRYELINYPFFSAANYVTMSKISTSMFGYTFRLDGFTIDQKKIFCIEAYLQLLYRRKHDWKKNVKVQMTTVNV